MTTIAIDCETHLISPGCITPKLVCVTTYNGEDGLDALLYDCEDGLALVEKLLSGDDHLTGQHFFYDLGVFCAEKAALLRLVFKKLDDGTIHCTKIRDMMILNAKGELKFVENELGEMKPAKFTLADLVWRRLGLQLSGKKDLDGWRLRYNELDGVPLDEWPDAARTYAMDDAGYTWMVHQDQEREVEPEGIPGEIGQTQAAWALHLMSAWGVRTDPEAVAAFEKQVLADYAEQEKLCMEYGFVRDDGSKNMKAIKEAIVDWFQAEGKPIPMTGKGNVKTDRKTLKMVEGGELVAVAELGRIGKLKTTYLPILKRGVEYPINANYNAIIETFRTSCRNPNCFDGETEVLTEHGWVRFDQLNPRKPVQVAQWENGVVSFTPWTAYHAYHNDAPLVRLTNDHIDLCVTSDHRCLLQNRKTNQLKVVEAKDYPEDYYQLHGGRYEGPGTLSLSQDEIVILCATQADGWWHDKGIEFSFSKERKIDRLIAAIERLSAPYSRRLKAPSKKGYKQETRIRIKKGALVQRIYDLLGEKKRLGSWLLQLDRERLDWFCDEVWHWDGCATRMNHYSSSDKPNVDWVQIALVLSSERANLRVYMPPSERPNYQVDVTHRDYSMTTNIERGPVLRSKVYCVSVPSSYLLVRRNGKTMVTGNCQNPPRKGGFRECFVPRLGWVYVFCDYGTLEMRTLAQVCLDLFEFSALADALNEGKDPHLMVGADILGISYDEALERLKAGDDEIKDNRQVSKPANFGFPGGMGPSAFVEYAEGYDIKVSLAKAKHLHKTFRRMWPEMKNYFAYCSGLVDRDRRRARFVEFVRSGLVRGEVKYTAICNGFFQHLAAMGAKAALYAVTKECYLGEKPDGTPSPLGGCRPVFFLHDEIGMEVPYTGEWEGERASMAADRLSQVMREIMEQWVPDVKILADSVMMRRWYKGAEPVRENGVLIPCKPIKKDGKTVWVRDAE